MTKPHVPAVPAHPPDEDPTGVRALLSSLPAPDPMPAHLVERINASLAAEQAQRSAEKSGSSVTPLLGAARRHRGRFLFALAGAAAVVAVATGVGNTIFKVNDSASTSAGSLTSAKAPEVSPRKPPGRPLSQPTPVAPARDQAPGDQRVSAARPASSTPEPGVAGPASGPVAAPGSASAPVQIRSSETRYTQTGFVTQAEALRSAATAPFQLQSKSADVGALGTTAGLTDCLNAIGAGGAQLLRADIAFYEGKPAVILVANTSNTTSKKTVAYAVGRQCSRASASVLRPATLLP